MSDTIKYLTKEEAALKLLQGETIAWLELPWGVVFSRFIHGQLYSRHNSKYEITAGRPGWTVGSAGKLLTLPDYEKLQTQKKAEEEKKEKKICCECGSEIADCGDWHYFKPTMEYTCMPCYKNKSTKEKPKERSKLEEYMFGNFGSRSIRVLDLPEIIEIIREELAK